MCDLWHEIKTRIILTIIPTNEETRARNCAEDRRVHGVYNYTVAQTDMWKNGDCSCPMTWNITRNLREQIKPEPPRDIFSTHPITFFTFDLK